MINLLYCVYLLLLARVEKERARLRAKDKKRREKYPERTRAWRIKNAEHCKNYDRKYKEENREKSRASAKAYREKFPEKVKACNAKCRAANPEYKKNWTKQNLEYYRERYKRLSKSNPEFKLTRNLRKRVWDALQGTCKSAKTLELLGCSASELRQHLEKQFVPGMSWENYGPVWHVDHIKPCAKFDLTDPTQQRECFHYSNLQPLWALENIKKGDS